MIDLSRRTFVTGSLGLSLAGCTTAMTGGPNVAAGTTCLPPVKVSPYRVIRAVAGLRPYRPSGYVVRRESIGTKALVHNYGHGGAGIALSWGSSREAVALGLPGHDGPVAVIGAGAMGLTTARLVQEAGFPVSIYAATLPPHTTSNIAGGQIIPASHYDPASASSEWRARASAAWTYTRERMQISVGADTGIRWLPTYDETSRDMRGAPTSAFPDRQILSPDEHPFPANKLQRYSALYVETGRWLDGLIRDLRIGGASLRVRRFENPAQFAALPERLIFNCTGLGSRALFGDSELEPARGPLAVLLPQPEVQYAFTGAGGYMFPRADGILLGGTFEHGEWVAEPQAEDIANIIRSHQSTFGRWRCA